MHCSVGWGGGLPANLRPQSIMQAQLTCSHVSLNYALFNWLTKSPLLSTVLTKDMEILLAMSRSAENPPPLSCLFLLTWGWSLNSFTKIQRCFLSELQLDSRASPFTIHLTCSWWDFELDLKCAGLALSGVLLKASSPFPFTHGPFTGLSCHHHCLLSPLLPYMTLSPRLCS